MIGIKNSFYSISESFSQIHRMLIIMVDEYRTSVMCSECGNEMKSLTAPLSTGEEGEFAKSILKTECYFVNLACLSLRKSHGDVSTKIGKN